MEYENYSLSLALFIDDISESVSFSVSGYRRAQIQKHIPCTLAVCALNV